MGSGSGAALPVSPSTASLATQTGNRQEQLGAVRQTRGTNRIESEESHMGVGNPSRIVLAVGQRTFYWRNEAQILASAHKRSGVDPRATPWDPTAFP